jgi:molybdopterin converting factor small subunit
MTDLVEIRVNFFGTLRRFEQIAPVILNLPTACDRNAVKAALWAKLHDFDADFSQEGLYAISVLANDDAIIDSHYRFTTNQTLALIPPVSGG